MPLERLRTCACRRILELNGAIVGPGRHELRVGRERDRVNVTAMPLERLRICARRRILDLNSPVV